MTSHFLICRIFRSVLENKTRKGHLETVFSKRQKTKDKKTKDKRQKTHRVDSKYGTSVRE
jgi:hypothetical protein